MLVLHAIAWYYHSGSKQMDFFHADELFEYSLCLASLVIILEYICYISGWFKVMASAEHLGLVSKLQFTLLPIQFSCSTIKV